LVLPIIAYTLSNKIRNKGKYFLPGSEGVGEQGRGRGREEGGINDPNIVCTYE
jgi:hypothetical protein